MNSLLNLPAFKVKKISTKKHFYVGNNTVQFASHPRVKLEVLNLSATSLDGSEDFNAILSKDSLKTVQFVNCPGIDCTALRDAATRHRFNFEETKDPHESRYTLTRL